MTPDRKPVAGDTPVPTLRPLTAILLCALALLPTTSAAADELVITEIMYDPASNEQWTAKTEWVEIYNRSDDPVSLEGWYLENERGQTQPIHESATITPGEAVVLIPGTQTADDFHAAWGAGCQVLPMAGWHQPGLHQLTNEPSETDGLLTLRRPGGGIADEVNYNNQGRWPTNKPDGPSIYLLPHAIDATANDDGANWARADVGRHGAYNAEPDGGYDPRDVGSPGTVATTDEPPAQDSANSDEPSAND